ncbi:FadR/GntR family transcriptional regulator [Martelella mangrovi]|uniref:DNA-binding FadR family transcriptional regulator n=1 Tax=Martelella mangrovi TaxID=1397477 RepID=A0ABV2IA72_9HYPH
MEENRLLVPLGNRAFCYEYRMGVEGEAAAMAARNRTSRDLKDIREAMHRLETTHATSEYSFELDFRFHLLVARATKNSFFLMSLERLRDTIYKGMLLAIAPSTTDRQEKNQAIRNQHRAVFEAIAAQDEASARDAMRLHLTKCRQSTVHWANEERELELEAEPI